MKTFAEFKEAMKAEEMQKKIAEYFAGKQIEDKEAKILEMVKFAAENGYEITAEDISLDEVGNRELSDEEVENAAGGLWCWDNYYCTVLYAENAIEEAYNRLFG